jgi:uncharacterized protein (TIGR02284 family)
MAQDDAAQAIKTLNQLIATCKDGENGFRTAAEGVKIQDVKTLFNSYSAQRARFVVELQAEVERLGGQPAEGGSLTATLHRGWMNVKSLVTGRDVYAMFAECRRAEEAAVKTYEEALKTPLPAEARAVVERQFEQIKEAHARVHALEEASTKVG